jgi:hypothetical protein
MEFRMAWQPAVSDQSGVMLLNGALCVIGGVAVLGAMNYLFLLGKVEPIQPKGRMKEIVVTAGGSAS